MSCGSTICTSTNYLETAASFPDPGWSRKIPLASLNGIALAWALRRQRRQLLELDDRLLSDVGISRRQAAEEAFKSSWARILMRPVP
jgi:uncharacterized protein YjiS (DUF1127 family)